MAYQLALPLNLKVHNAFHNFVLKIYVQDTTHVINWNDVQVESKGDFLVEPDCILDKNVLSLLNRTIGQVKVQWKHPDPKEETWELESHMRA